MAFFRKKAAPTQAAAKPAEPSVPVPHLRGDQQALGFEAQLARGRWQEFHDFLESLTDRELRHFYVVELARISGRPEWVDEWVAAKPGSSLPMLFRGAHGINWAWEARTSDRAKYVKEEAWPLFHSRLVEADRDLARAAALDDRDPAPHAMSETVARGLSLPTLARSVPLSCPRSLGPTAAHGVGRALLASSSRRERALSGYR
jgi:hypothetical protein